MSEDGITLLVVVDDEEPSRTQLLLALRRLGLRALGVDSIADAVALLEALDADVTLLRGAAASDAAAVVRLRQKSRVVLAPRGAPLEQTMMALLRVLGQPEPAALIN